MKYKVFAFDLDGTLTNSEKIITERTKKALYKIREKGATLVLASGRPVYGIMHLAKELEMDKYGGYILAFNGGHMIDCRTMECIYDKKMPTEVIPKICRFAEKENLALLTYENKTIITNKPNEYVQRESEIVHLPVRKIDNLEKHINFSVNKFLFVEHPDTILTYLDKIQSTFPEVNVFRSAPFLMEIVPPEVDKAAALESLLKILSFTKDDLAAFGDGDNDVSMLKFAGCGVAMQNASDLCKNAADLITLSNDEDGVAITLEHFMKES